VTHPPPRQLKLLNILNSATASPLMPYSLTTAVVCGGRQRLHSCLTVWPQQWSAEGDSVSTHALQSNHSSGLQRETSVSTHALQSDHSNGLQRETSVSTHALHSDHSSGLQRETASPYCYKLSMLHSHA